MVKKNKSNKNIFSSAWNSFLNWFNFFSKNNDQSENFSLEGENFTNKSENKNLDSMDFDLLKENARLNKVKNKILSEKKGEDFVDKKFEEQSNTAQFLFENIFEAEKLKEKLEELNLEKNIDIKLNDDSKKSYTLKFDDDFEISEKSDSNSTFNDFEYEEEFDLKDDDDDIKKNEQINLNDQNQENEDSLFLKKKELKDKFPIFLLKEEDSNKEINYQELIGKYKRKINYILRNINFPGEIFEINKCSTFITFNIKIFKNFNINDLYLFKSYFNNDFYKVKYRFDINDINKKNLLLEIKNNYFNFPNFKNLITKAKSDFIEEKIILGENYNGQEIYKSLSKLFIVAQNEDKINFVNNLITTIILTKDSSEIKFKILNNENFKLAYDDSLPYFIKSKDNINYSLQEIIDIFEIRNNLFKKYNVSNFDKYNKFIIGKEKAIEKIILIIPEVVDILNNNDSLIISKFEKIIEYGEKFAIYPIILTSQINDENLKKFNLNLFKKEQKILFYVNDFSKNYIFKEKAIDQLFLIGDFLIYNQNKFIHCQQTKISEQELKLINNYLKNFYNFKNRKKKLNKKMKSEKQDEKFLEQKDFLIKSAKIILCEKKEINLQTIQSYMGINYNEAYLILDNLFKYKIIEKEKNNNNFYKLINEDICNEVRDF